MKVFKFEIPNLKFGIWNFKLKNFYDYYDFT
jgi:hypothetical protein